MASFVLYNPAMLIPVAVCRLPRFIMIMAILIFLNKFETDQKKKWYKIENLIRLATTILMPLFSIGIQCQGMLVLFCPRHPSLVNQETCVLRYGITMGVLILVHTALDTYL